MERHYVDDYCDCFNDEKEAVEVVNQIIKIHREAGLCSEILFRTLSMYESIVELSLATHRL